MVTKGDRYPRTGPAAKCLLNKFCLVSEIPQGGISAQPFPVSDISILSITEDSTVRVTLT